MPVISGTRVTEGQAEVYEVLRTYGPVADHALVPLAQHQMSVRQSSSGIRTRRKELTDLGLVKPLPTVVKTGSGRAAKVYSA